MANLKNKNIKTAAASGLWQKNESSPSEFSGSGDALEALGIKA